MFNLSVAFCVQTSPLWVFNINNLCLLYPSTFIFVDDFLLIDYIRSLLWITSPFFNGLVILIQLVFGTILFMDYNLILWVNSSTYGSYHISVDLILHIILG